MGMKRVDMAEAMRLARRLVGEAKDGWRVLIAAER